MYLCPISYMKYFYYVIGNLNSVLSSTVLALIMYVSNFYNVHRICYKVHVEYIEMCTE